MIVDAEGGSLRADLPLGRDVVRCLVLLGVPGQPRVVGHGRADVAEPERFGNGDGGVDNASTDKGEGPGAGVPGGEAAGDRGPESGLTLDSAADVLGVHVGHWLARVDRRHCRVTNEHDPVSLGAASTVYGDGAVQAADGLSDDPLG